MASFKSVKNDLKDIRYFFSHQQVFNDPRMCVSEQLQEKIRKFNIAVSLAPPRLYVVYVELYLNNNTQKELALDWGFTENYICKLNSRLCEYLVNFFNNCANKVTGKGETA